VVNSSGQIVIDQESLQTWVFTSLIQNENLNFRYRFSVLTEYIRSLHHFNLTVHFGTYDILIKLLVQHEKYYYLHQYIQYHIIRDSFNVACILLHLESKYPPAYQLGMDMLKRLGLMEQAVEVFLKKHDVTNAIRYVRAANLTFQPAKCLEVALTSKDKMLFYTVYSYFEERNQLVYNINLGRSDFYSTESCEKYIAYFKENFKKQQEETATIAI